MLVVELTNKSSPALGVESFMFIRCLFLFQCFFFLITFLYAAAVGIQEIAFEKPVAPTVVGGSRTETDTDTNCF